MATKKDIVAEVVAHLHSVTGQYTVDGETYELSPDAIRPQYPNGEEYDCAIGWTDSYNRVQMNGVGNAVLKDRDQNGVVTKETHKSPSAAQFIITVQAPNVPVLDVLYEEVYRAFDKYKATDLKARDFHNDVSRISATQTTSLDDEDADDVLRRDQLTVELLFERRYETDIENISTIRVDIDGDGTYEYEVN